MYVVMLSSHYFLLSPFPLPLSCFSVSSPSTFMSLCMCDVCAYVYTHVHVCERVCVREYVCSAYVCVYTCACVHVYAHAMSSLGLMGFTEVS